MNNKALRTSWRVGIIPIVVAVLAACADGVPSAPTPVEPNLSHESSGAVLLVCPTDNARTTSMVLDASGGVLKLGGHRMTLPPGAIAEPTEFRLREPVSQHMEIEVTAAGQEHYQFLKPVTLTIDYSRCSRPNDRTALTVFYIDTSHKTLLENMGGADDRLARRITIGTDHLSSYALAEP